MNATPLFLQTRRDRVLRDAIAKRVPIYRQPIHRPRLTAVDADVVIECVAHNVGLSVGELLSDSREARIVLPRQVGMFLAWILCDGMSLPKIAHAFGRKDHTTAMYARDRVDARLQIDEEFRSWVEHLRSSIELVQLDLNLAGVREKETERIMGRSRDAKTAVAVA